MHRHCEAKQFLSVLEADGMRDPGCMLMIEVVFNAFAMGNLVCLLVCFYQWDQGRIKRKTLYYMRQTKPKCYSILYHQLHSYSYALSFKLHGIITMGIWKTGDSFLTYFSLIGEFAS